MSIRSILVVLALVLQLPTVFAQEDTLTVRTLTFDSITTRSGIWNFPDSTHTYRKVLMHHTLKCSPLTTQDQYPCGEWDYLTYTFVNDHTGAYDSTLLEHPWFLVGSAAPDTLYLSNVPVFDIQQTLLTGSMPTEVENEQTFAIGESNALDQSMLDLSAGAARSQYLFTASELSASGLSAGAIQQLRLTTDANGTAFVERCTVRLKGTSATSLASFDNAALQTVYDFEATDLGSMAGEHILHFDNPFNWDGSSNILVDIAVYTTDPQAGPGVIATEVASGIVLKDNAADGYIGMENGHVAVDASRFAELGTSITVTFRARGGASIPVNTSIFEGLNAQGQRVMNVHLPWSNSRVYWDAGNEGSSYDRIDKEALPANLEGDWNHWAFVKNTATGIMRIYLNGSLWHTGTGKTKPMSGITSFKIGSAGMGQYPYPGQVDEFNVFAAEVSAATINAWKDRKVDATHPDAASLLYSFHFDEAMDDHSAINSADPSASGTLMGTVQRMQHAATEIGGSSVASLQRPDLTFVTGDYTSEDVTAVIEVPAVHAGISQQYFMVQGNFAVPTDTVFGWDPSPSYLYDPDGGVIDSTIIATVMSVNDTLTYHGVPFEVIDRYEIGRFITPYGINLSLGTNGFRWTYDVTDYQWLLHDSVDLSAGNQQELIDVTFELIEGTPPREVIRMQRPWGPQRSYSYAGLSDNSSLAPVTIGLHPEATHFTVGARFTGHGHASNTGNYPHCCEWKDNTHMLKVNGATVDQWHIWQTNQCALNPVYPQGGTWLGAREGWCPGDLVKDHLTDITPHVNGDEVTLDYSITPVPSNNLGMGAGNYVVNMDLYEYAPPAFALDAEIVNVERPSTTDYHRRDNPICYDPLVILRNAGVEALTSVTFTYGVSGGTPLTHVWNGNLGPMSTIAVTLPVDDDAFWNGDDDHRFTVSVEGPNGGQDQHAANDSYAVNFSLPAVYNEIFVLDYRTNNRPQENTVTVRDIHGAIVFQRGSHTANTSYRDTLDLLPGCYTLEVLDTGNDGLSYWADTQQGSGYFRIRRLNNIIVQNFQAEFGRKIHWAFTYSTSVGIQEAGMPVEAKAYPNPGRGLYTLELSGLVGKATMLVTDASGRTVQERRVELFGSDRMDLDLRDHAEGLYGIRVITEEHAVTLRVVKQ